MEKCKAIVMKSVDNVATAVEDLPAGYEVSFTVNGEAVALLLKDNIPFGHKFAIKPITQAAKVMKYGEPIGAASENIEAGRHVHVHNMGGLRGRGDLQA